MTGYDSKRQAAMDKLVATQEELGMYDDQKPEPEKINGPTKEWFDWYTSPPIDYRKVYGDAFVWTEQEKQLMVLLKLKEKQ